MKKLLLLFSFALLAIVANAQLPIVGFQSVQANPVQVRPRTNTYSNPLDPLGIGGQRTTPQVQRQEPQYEKVSGYIYTNNGWAKVTLKVGISGNNIFVNSYFDKNSNLWCNGFNTTAYPVTKSDGQELYNLFDFKVSIAGLGKVYF